MIEGAARTIANDKKQQTTDTEFKVATDGMGVGEAPGGIIKATRGTLFQETADNFTSVGKRLGLGAKGAGSSISSAGEIGADGVRAGAAPLFSSGPGAGRSLGVVAGGKDAATTGGDALTARQALVASTPAVGQDGAVLTGTTEGGAGATSVARGAGTVAQVGEDAVDTSRAAAGINAATGGFDSLKDAGYSVSKFMLNKTTGMTSEIGLEAGSKVLGAAGGLIAGGTDISNLMDTGKVFKPHESGWSEAGNIGTMAGAALDMASIAVPVLAPLALATNLLSAAASTWGQHVDDAGTISRDSKPPPSEVLSTHPAFAAVGMVASVHSQSSIVS
tara:strand:+ start:1218 stop:2216 length:999 start_codon:yes stop_codon:yes gene_type:complete